MKTMNEQGLQDKHKQQYLSDLNSATTQKWYGRPLREGENCGYTVTFAEAAKEEGVSVGALLHGLGITLGRVQMTDGELSGLDIERQEREGQ